MNILFRATSAPASGSILGSTLIHTAAFVLIPMQFVYTVSFNFTPDSVRLLYVGAITLAYGLVSTIALISRPSKWNGIILLCGFVAFLCWATTYSFVPAQLDWQTIFRDLSPYFSIIWILSFPEVLPLGLLSLCVSAALIIASLLAFIGPHIILDDVERLASITGGSDAVHPSAYFFGLNVLIMDQLRRLRRVPSPVAWALIGLGMFVLLRYQVRTVFVILLAYFVCQAYLKYRHRFLVRALPYFFVGFVAVYLFGFFGLTDVDIEKLGSGRGGAYIQRIHVLENRDALTFLFGSGPGSDKFEVPGWWGLKDSHNDFLHVLVERGFIGLVALLIFLGAIGSRLHGHARTLLVAMIAGSMFSNALLARPALIVYMFYAMALANLVVRSHSPDAARRAGKIPWPRAQMD